MSSQDISPVTVSIFGLIPWGKTVTKQKYMALMSTAGAWGGEMEIEVLAKILKRPILVVSALDKKMPPLLHGEEYKNPPIILHYTGSHYQQIKSLDTSISDQILFRIILNTMEVFEAHKAASVTPG